MKKINFDELKKKVCEKAKVVGEKTKDVIEEHGNEIMYGVLIGGLVITYGQSINYMRLLNKAAKQGNFRFIPGHGYI